MQEPKKPSHVRGNRIMCPKFVQCPICYGCRSFSSHDLDCIECEVENKKKNICNVELHKPQIIANFITKNKVEIQETLEVKSERK